MTNLPEHVEQSVRQRKLFRRGERILVAVSGGVDSMALLHILHALASKHAWLLAVAHFNHQLRGRASAGDEAFVKRVAVGLGVRCCVGRGDVKSTARARGISIEMAARELRHAFLAKAARQMNCRSIALAHHADDQVELFFLRLLRGSGGEGLGGMQWISPSPAESARRLVRPLLDVPKGGIETFARTDGIRFRRDASNTSHEILRNRVRHELLPLVRRKYQPALDKSVWRVMELIGREAEAITTQARQWLHGREGAEFDQLPVALQRRVIQLQLRERGLPEDFDGVEFLRRFPDRVLNLDSATSVMRDAAGRLQFRSLRRTGFKLESEVISLRGKSGTALFDGVRLEWRVAKADPRGNLARRQGQELFDARRIGNSITLRHWQRGDRFQPIGMEHAIKLQDWFVNLKIPQARRHELIVAVAAGGEIFWVEGTRIGERFKLTPKTRHALGWRWHRKSFIAGH